MTMDSSVEQKFAAWLAMQEGLMDEFESVDVPELPADQFSLEGLQVAEAALLRDFADFDATMRSEPSRELYDKFARFLGETIRRAFGGEWRLSPDDGTTPLVFLPEEISSIPFDPYGLVRTTLYRRTSEEWAKVFSRLRDR